MNPNKPMESTELTRFTRDGVRDQGIFAWCDGRPRDDHPFKMTTEGQIWIAIWQEGWDVAALNWCTFEGRSAKANDRNPYPAHSEEAAAWLKGWRESHKFAAVDGNTAPVPRQKAG